MTDTSIASDLLQSLDVEGCLSSEITFYCKLLIDDVTDSRNFLIC